MNQRAHYLQVLIACLMTGFAMLTPVHAEQPRLEHSELSREYQIKAAMLYKFVWFVRWKSGDFKDKKSPISLCLSEPEPFGGYLDQLVEGRLFGKNKRKISVRRFDKKNYLDHLQECHVLFIPKGSDVPVPQKKGLLVVTDGRPIEKSSAHINFITSGNYVRFEINRNNLKKSHIRLSSKLLKLARVVGD